MGNRISVYLMFVGCLAAMTISGCSLGGFLVGTIIDESKSAFEQAPRWNVELLKVGADITITKAWGGAVSGKYLGIGCLTPEEYSRRYAIAQELNREMPILPELFHGVTIVRGSSRYTHGEFLGFDWRGMDQECVVIRKSGIESPDTLNLGQIKRIEDDEGHSIRAKVLQRLMREKKIPVLSAMLILCESDTVQVPFDEIDDIAWHERSKRAALWGFRVGACIDIVSWLAQSH